MSQKTLVEKVLRFYVTLKYQHEKVRFQKMVKLKERSCNQSRSRGTPPPPPKSVLLNKLIFLKIKLQKHILFCLKYSENSGLLYYLRIVL